MCIVERYRKPNRGSHFTQKFNAHGVNKIKKSLETETVRHSGVGGSGGAHAAHRRRTHDAYPGTDCVCCALRLRL